ncbi:MAG: SBBP repeat-containing protein [Acidimicrobiales bacterium]|nr:SBBP repeat-containing protein [Acidimicrobiales bacterium]
MAEGVRRVALRVRVVSAVLLSASTLVWVSGSPVGAWSSDDSAVAVFGSASDSVEIGYSVAVDSSGNVYTAGLFRHTVDFDPGAGTTNLTSNGNYDGFVSKLDSSGDLVWAKSFGDTGTDGGYSVAVDSSGNVYTAGYFSDTVDFDPGSGTAELTSNAGVDAFVLKLDSSGNLATANPAGVSVSKATVSVSEAGPTAEEFTVVLDAPPTSDVVLTVTSADTGEATVSPATLTFTNGNWDSAQTVTVTGVNDVVDDGDQETTITVAVDDANSDDTYDNVADSTVTATTADDDTAGYTLSDTTVTVAETGTTATFTVVLDTQPISDVVFSVSSADTGEATVSPATLTFTSSNWSTSQYVTVTGVNDVVDVDDPEAPGTLALPVTRTQGTTSWKVLGENEHGRGPASELAARLDGETANGGTTNGGTGGDR